MEPMTAKIHCGIGTSGHLLAVPLKCIELLRLPER
jgi:hypothetical protein